jgi:hypothetical protein
MREMAARTSLRKSVPSTEVSTSNSRSAPERYPSIWSAASAIAGVSSSSIGGRFMLGR